MFSFLPNILAGAATGVLTPQTAARVRFLSMFAVLICGVTSGCIAAARFRLPQDLAKKLMIFVLVVLNWPIALVIIWRMQLSKDVIWLPIVGGVLVLTVTGLSAIIFSLYSLDTRSKLTLILAGGLSNLGYTGGAFVCYTLFGLIGLGLAYIYLMFWPLLVGFIFFPVLKIIEQKNAKAPIRLSFTFLGDYRLLAIPAIIAGLILNASQIQAPAFISRFHITDIFIYVAAGLSFFAIGLRVTFAQLKTYLRLYFPLTAVKFVLTPTVALLLLWILTTAGWNLSSMARNVIIVQSAAPSAVTMVTMSHVFDLDNSLASAVWVASTAVFIVVVAPLLFLIFA